MASHFSCKQSSYDNIDDSAENEKNLSEGREMEIAGLIFLAVVGTSIWVYFDAKSIGAYRPCFLAFGCLAIWIVVFPMYVSSRQKIIQRNANKASQF